MPQSVKHGLEETRIGICLGEGDPDVAHTESNLGPDLEEFQADRAALCLRELGS